MRVMMLLLLMVFLASCGGSAAETVHSQQPSPAVEANRARREVRLTGLVEATRSSKVTVPQIVGQVGRLTLTGLIANGAHVREGDVVAEFDPTQQLDLAFTAQAKYEDLSHQVDQKIAQNRADAEKRLQDLAQAQADLGKALLDLQKAEVISEIDALKNKEKAEIARLHAESLRKSNAFHDDSAAAALRILELQRDRQKVAMERAQSNINRLQIRSPLAGMVGYQNIFRGNSSGHAQEGDQLFTGQAILNIFDPAEMRVRCLVGEPDGVHLAPGTVVQVHFDAYPDLMIPGRFEFASPIAISALGSPIKTFTAVFKLDRTDPRLMPDLSAAVVIEPDSGSEK